MKALWLSAATACGVGIAAATLAPTSEPVVAPVPPPVRAEAKAPPVSKRNRVTDPVILARNVFSTTRRPPARRFDPARGRGPETPRPALVLEGIVGGAVPSALIRVPATEGARVVAPGEGVVGYTLLRLANDSAVLVMRSDTLVLIVGGARP